MRAEDQLAAFLARFTPDIATRADDVLARLRARMPNAVQLIYDNYNALVIGFGPNERASDAIFSVAIYPRWINLFFLQAVKQRLADPKSLLRGEGKVVRHVRIDDASSVESRDMRQLIDRSLRDAHVPLPVDAPGYMVVRAIADYRRARRPAGSDS